MTVSYRLSEIVAQLGGRVLGDAGVRISQIATLEKAQPDQISFLTNSKYRAQLASTKAGAVILADADADATGLPRIISDNAYAYFAKVSALLNPLPEAKPGIHPSAVIGAGREDRRDGQHRRDCSDRRGRDDRCAQRDRRGLLHRSECGHRQPCAPVSASGDLPRLRDRRQSDRAFRRGDRSGWIRHCDGCGSLDQDSSKSARVVIGNDVEIGANTTIDRGALDDTVIEDGVKLDNLIQIAHNVRIGAHTAMAGCAGIAGSTTIGRYCRDWR